MSRSIWKPIYRTTDFERSKLSGSAVLVSSRAMKLTNDLLGQNLFVHSGRRFINFTVETEHLGRKAGEFSHTHLKPKVIRKKGIKKKW